MEATTAAAPAVTANLPAAAEKAVALAHVVPMTFLRCKPGSSCRPCLVGDRGVGERKKGELEGVNRKAGWWEVMLPQMSVVDYATWAHELLASNASGRCFSSGSAYGSRGECQLEDCVIAQATCSRWAADVEECAREGCFRREVNDKVEKLKSIAECDSMPHCRPSHAGRRGALATSSMRHGQMLSVCHVVCCGQQLQGRAQLKLTFGALPTVSPLAHPRIGCPPAR